MFNIKSILLAISLFYGCSLYSQNTPSDTTISVSYLSSLENIKGAVSEKNLMLHTLKNIIKRDQAEIINLKLEIKELSNKINSHNKKLKKSQEKFIIN